jgi:hypothetical protein
VVVAMMALTMTVSKKLQDKTIIVGRCLLGHCLYKDMTAEHCQLQQHGNQTLAEQ